MIEAILGVIILSYLRGSEDGKWGCFLAIVVFFFIALIVSEGG